MLFTESRSIESNTRPSLKYGEIWNYTSNATAWEFLVDSVDVYYNLTNLSAGDLDGFTFISSSQEEGGDYLITKFSGTYLISFSSSFAADGKGLYSLGVAKNFDINNCRDCYARRSISSPDVVGNIGITCILSLEVGDTLNIVVEVETSPIKHLDFHTVNLNVVRIDR